MWILFRNVFFAGVILTRNARPGEIANWKIHETFPNSARKLFILLLRLISDV